MVFNVLLCILYWKQGLCFYCVCLSIISPFDAKKSFFLNNPLFGKPKIDQNRNTLKSIDFQPFRSVNRFRLAIPIKTTETESSRPLSSPLRFLIVWVFIITTSQWKFHSFHGSSWYQYPHFLSTFLSLWCLANVEVINNPICSIWRTTSYSTQLGPQNWCIGMKVLTVVRGKGSPAMRDFLLASTWSMNQSMTDLTV